MLAETAVEPGAMQVYEEFELCFTFALIRHRIDLVDGLLYYFITQSF